MNINGTFRSYFGAVAVPVLDSGNGRISNVTHDWSNSAAGLGGGLAITILRLNITNFRVDVAKQRLAEMALINNCQFVFFLDDDVIPPPETLMKMIRLWRSDSKYKVISGVYWSKSNPPTPLIFRGNLESSFWDWKTTDLIKADGAGAGCLFVDTEVFRKLPKPWFSGNYFFEDPRTEYDLKKWTLVDQLTGEFSKGKDRDKKTIKEIEKNIVDTAEQSRRAMQGEFDPNLLKDKHRDPSTTEDLYFFKKVKEYLNLDLWVDCSIQCLHQDKATGRVWGIQPDMPQARPRYEGKMERDKKVVLDIGAGEYSYYIQSGKPITIDNDPKVEPDILADARNIPLNDCFADEIYASHMLEHFSFHETLSVLKEWIRILKIGGKLAIVVPNLKWASKKILNNEMLDEEEAKRTMFMYYSGQRGDLKDAHDDVHRSGFISESLKGVLERIDTLKDVRVYTTDANFGVWDEKEYLHDDDLGYNVIAFATKAKHDSAISLKLNLPMQDQAQYHIGDKANTNDCFVTPGHRFKKGVCIHCGKKEDKKVVKDIKKAIKKVKEYGRKKERTTKDR